MPSPIYLVDHESYKPPESYKILIDDVRSAWCKQLKDSTEEEREAMEAQVQATHEFMEKVFANSGLSPTGTYLPPAIHPKNGKPKQDMNSAMAEAKEVMTGAVQGLLQKVGITAQEVDILVTTCSIFCPTPSLSAMLVNHFGMRTDVQAYHLGGMGCSMGVVGINLVRDLLKAHPNTNALFVSHETMSNTMYVGADKSRLVANVLFRMGASAALLSNKRSWASTAKYELKACVRVHHAASEEAYRCIWYGPDDAGINGTALKTSVVSEASKAITSALTRVAPSVMTWSQICKYLLTEAHRWAAKQAGASAPPPYKPRFSEGVQHFMLHAGSAKVLDKIEAALQLNPEHLEASRAVLYDYGNVSSSTTWYALGFTESVKGVKAGDKVMQVGVGSGVKCGVNVWKALRDVDSLHDAWDSRVSPERRAAALAARQPPKRSKVSLAAWPHQLQHVLMLVMVLLVAVLSMLPRAMLSESVSHLI